MNRFHLLLGSVTAATATVVAMVILVNPSPAPENLFNGLHLSAPEPELIDDEILNAKTVSYQSDSMEYRIVYPGSWVLDDTKTQFNGHILTDPLEKVVITITETENSALATAEGRVSVAKTIKDAVQYDPAFSLSTFETFSWGGHVTMFTNGVRLIGGKRYHSREYNIVRDDHLSMLNVSITTDMNLDLLYEEKIQEILNSLLVCHDLV